MGREGGGASDVPQSLFTLVDDGSAPTFPLVSSSLARVRRVLGGWTEGPAARHTCQSGLVGVCGAGSQVRGVASQQPYPPVTPAGPKKGMQTPVSVSKRSALAAT